jgi:uncharacterized protein YcaQ
MVRKRHNFQRIYDLRERVLANVEELPDTSADTSADVSADVSLADAHDQFVLNTIQALGVVKAEWIADYFRLSKTDARAP